MNEDKRARDVLSSTEPRIVVGDGESSPDSESNYSAAEDSIPEGGDRDGINIASTTTPSRVLLVALRRVVLVRNVQKNQLEAMN